MKVRTLNDLISVTEECLRQGVPLDEKIIFAVYTPIEGLYGIFQNGEHEEAKFECHIVNNQLEFYEV